MSQILTDIKKHGVPELTSRSSLRESRDAVMSTGTLYGPLLQQMDCVTCDGESVSIPITDPLASLTIAINEDSSFRSFFRQRLVDRPSTPESPWTIVLYSDEVTPGNALA